MKRHVISIVAVAAALDAGLMLDFVHKNPLASSWYRDGGHGSAH